MRLGDARWDWFTRVAFSVACLGATACEATPEPSVVLSAAPVAAEATPPVSGGTIIALRGGGRAVVSDIDDGAVHLVDLHAKGIVRTIPLEDGADPGRLVEDTAGRVHVVLRGTGEVLTFDPSSAAQPFRRAACKAPRGLAVDRQTNGLLVACLEGVLVEFSHDGQAPLRRTFVDTDLRDVLFAGSDLVVTRFRSAEVLYLDAERRVRSRHTLVPNQAGVVPAVAWRAVPTADGSVAVIHQNASLRILDPGPVGGSGGAPAGTGGSPSGSAVGTGGSVVVYYGTRASCSSIVTSSISIINALGEIRHSPSLAGATLPVDIAEGPDGAFVVAVGAARGTRFLEFGRQTVTSSPGTCAFAQSFGPTVFSTSTAAAAASGVAIEPVTGAVLVHRRRHPAIEVYAGGDPVEIPLVRPGTQRWISDGHDLFHADGGFGVACASCHPEGTDDGQVWNFSKGPRRTQPLDVRLSGTAPFHWNGEFENFGALFDDIFAVRMGGGRRTAEQIGSLERFIYRLRPRPALRDPSDDAAERGRPLFEARCANCHAGPRFTSSQSTDIGKGAPTQVPSLLGVGVRAPFMHDGCAPTLAARFEPTCGGTAHGDLNGLDDAGRADLVSYLESL